MLPKIRTNLCFEFMLKLWRLLVEFSNGHSVNNASFKAEFKENIIDHSHSLMTIRLALILAINKLFMPL